jgi:hypothetical protein
MTTKQTVLDFFSAEDEAQCERHIYKYTDCGAWIEFNDEGIRIGSIVEGCDFGTWIYPLRYADNFTAADIQARIDAVEKEATAIWEWANEGPEGSDETYASLGLDCPDVGLEFIGLNPEGRSC